jgi:ATP-dependent DNA helicase RecG
MTLSTPIEQITSIGRKVAPALKKLGLVTAQDLIFYWPFRYEDWSKVKPIAEIIPGEAITTRGTLEMIQNKRHRYAKRMVTEAIISDSSGSIRAVWFHQPYLVKNFKTGDEIFLSGQVETGSAGLQFTHPNYEKITKHRGEPTHTARIVPMYSLTKRVTQKQLRYLISQAVKLAAQVEEWIPSDFIKQYKLLELAEAIKQIHFPDSTQALNKAQHRLKYNELFLINLRAQVNKQAIAQAKAPSIKFNQTATKKFVDSLPFDLTDAQRKTSWEIIQDLEKTNPMNRLLEGDVGSGKTVVASLAVLNVLLNQYQVAYMAPTEILAQQQFESFCKLFAKHDFNILLLTGSQAKSNKAESLSKAKALKQISSETANLLIGTHSLIQEKVNFPRLGLAIIDEQHRFGVDQRAALTKYSPSPHFLSMSATPMPRSLALTVYDDLDLSIIDQMPPGRKPIDTKLIPPEKRGEYYKFIQAEVNQGRQVFVICPLIDPSDKLGKKAATEEYEKLNTKIFPELRIGLVHGRLKAKDKDQQMQKFYRHEYDILVATPVIEVGIDITNATVMMIESAERFGLASLHQFRGRVGRGQHQSYCFLFTETQSQSSLNRLQALVDSQDGFALAEADLEFRGPGEIYGVRQHGFDDVLKIARLTDYAIIQETQKSVGDLLNTDPTLAKFPKIKAKLDQFESQIHLE